MTFKELLNKIAGARYRCASGCCGVSGSVPLRDEPGFDTVLVARLIVACLLFAAALILKKLAAPWPLILLILSAVVAGYDILAAAVLAVMEGRYFDNCVLITAVAVIAFGIGQSGEAAALILLFQLGGVLLDYVSSRTRATVIDAVYAGAETARVERGGAEENAAAEDVKVGDVLRLRQGETVACDCIVLSGSGTLDETPLGGEGEAVPVSEGDELPSGCVCSGGELRCEVTAVSGESAAAVRKRALSQAAGRGDAVPHRLRRVVSLLPPVLVILAVLAAGIQPLVYKISIIQSIHRALVFLIVADPCALLAAIPLVRWCAMGDAARSGILYGSNAAMDAAGHADTVAFARTGALTEGSPRVSAVKAAERMNADTLLKITAHAMAYSANPLAKSVMAAYGGTIYIELVKDFSETPAGVEVFVDGVRICAGSLAFIRGKDVSVPDTDVSDDVSLYVSIAESYAGRIVFADGLRPDAAAGVAELEHAGVSAVLMFTEEAPQAAAKSAAALGIREYYAECGREKTLSTLAEVRRGISDGGALLYVSGGEPEAAHTEADADVSLCPLSSLGEPGSADIRIFSGSVSGVAGAVTRARRAEKLMYAEFGAAALVKLILLVLGFTGIATLWFAVFIDAAAAIGAVLASSLAFRRG